MRVFDGAAAPSCISILRFEKGDKLPAAYRIRTGTIFVGNIVSLPEAGTHRLVARSLLILAISTRACRYQVTATQSHGGQP
jgi:hypothetical protein